MRFVTIRIFKTFLHTIIYAMIHVNLMSLCSKHDWWFNLKFDNLSNLGKGLNIVLKVSMVGTPALTFPKMSLMALFCKLKTKHPIGMQWCIYNFGLMINEKKFYLFLEIVHECLYCREHRTQLNPCNIFLNLTTLHKNPLLYGTTTLYTLHTHTLYLQSTKYWINATIGAPLPDSHIILKTMSLVDTAILKLILQSSHMSSL